MRDIREEIEEIIEESYLVGMSEVQIRSDLSKFVDSCMKVISENIEDEGSVEELISKLTYVKTKALATDSSGGGRDLLGKDARTFAEKVAQNKRLILRIISEYDPELVDLVNQERFGKKTRMKWRVAAPWGIGRIPGRGNPKSILLKVLYVLMALSIFLLLYVMISKV